MKVPHLWLAACAFGCLSTLGATAPELEVFPRNPLLFGNSAEQRLLVLAHHGDGRLEDVTAEARFRSANPSVAVVSPSGVVQGQAFGGARIEVSYQGARASTTALVQRTDRPAPVSFGGDVMPLLTKMGCSGGNCHGAITGQNGFKLSLFGYHPAEDYAMIAEKHEGRRIDLDNPANSLLLRKPTLQQAHGGGLVFPKDSDAYRTILAWIASGARLDPSAEKRLESLVVHPSEIVLPAREISVQLLVTARFSDGSEADFTRLAHFEAHDDTVVEVDPGGKIKSLARGQTTVLVRALGAVAAARVGVVTERHPVPDIASDHPVDRHVFRKLRELHVPPSPVADDATFLRRVYLDTIGVIPSAQETREFLSDSDPDKRLKVVDRLLDRPEYADFWSLYWGDHLNNTKQLLYNKGPYTFTRWLYNAFRQNMPYDKFVRALMTSSGNMYNSPATSFYPLMKKPLDLAAQASQLFLGVRIDCARCHDHPMERWSQDDYNGMAAYFSQIKYKGGVGPRNNERALYVEFDRQFEHPENGKTYRPKPLGGPRPQLDDSTDRREALVDWMTADDNPFFSRAIANRMWRQFMGRGVVEPVDDFRDTNPPANPELLDALAREFVASGYDLHDLIRMITSSRAYQLSSVPTEANADDTQGHSHYYARRLSAEQLLDSISLATGVPEAFPSLYPGTRAAQLPEPEVPSYFLDVFDRPSRQLVSDRATTSSLNQALHMVSGKTVQKKVSGKDSVLRRMIEEDWNDRDIIEELYLRTVSRRPEPAEIDAALSAAEAAEGRRQGLEDVFWALLNSKEFLYQH